MGVFDGVTVLEFGHPALGPVTVLGAPVTQGDDAFVAGGPTPAFGSETRDILSVAGFAAHDVDRLLKGDAVRSH